MLNYTTGNNQPWPPGCPPSGPYGSPPGGPSGGPQSGSGGLPDRPPGDPHIASPVLSTLSSTFTLQVQDICIILCKVINLDNNFDD